MRILGIDPGGTTGWAVWDEGFREFGQLGPGEHHDELWNLLTSEWLKADVYVLESFKPYGDIGAERISLEYIGIVKAVCKLFNIRLAIQSSNILQWATKDKVVRLGAKHQSWHGDKDAVSAQKHIMYYLCHNVHIPYEEQRRILKAIGQVK